MIKFSSRVKKQLDYYVYLYIDPADGEVFYVGKGKGNRAFAHLKSNSSKSRDKRIQKILKSGQEPLIEILKYGLNNKQALLVESTAIDLLNIKKLTNLVRGHGSKFGSRASAHELATFLGGKKAVITEQSVLINVARYFNTDYSPAEIYDATRTCWRVDINRAKYAKLAFCVNAGVIREVYEIAGWFPGHSTMQTDDTTECSKKVSTVRYEFIGRIANQTIRKKYVGRTATDYFKKGAQNPIKYVKC